MEMFVAAYFFFLHTRIGRVLMILRLSPINACMVIVYRHLKIGHITEGVRRNDTADLVCAAILDSDRHTSAIVGQLTRAPLVCCTKYCAPARNIIVVNC